MGRPLPSLSRTPAGCRIPRGPHLRAYASAAIPSGSIGPTKREDRSIGSNRRRRAAIVPHRKPRRRRLAKRGRIGLSAARANGPVRRRKVAKRQKARGAGEASVPPAPSSSERERLEAAVASLSSLNADQLRLQWRNHLGGIPPAHLPGWLLARVLAYRIQAAAFGDLNRATLRRLREMKGEALESAQSPRFATRGPTTREGVGLKSGALVVREWNGRTERVMVLDEGHAWNGSVYRSLSQVAKAITGTSWNGHRFFGLKGVRDGISRRKEIAAPTSNAALGTGVSHPRQAQTNQEMRG